MIATRKALPTTASAIMIDMSEMGRWRERRMRQMASLMSSGSTSVAPTSLPSTAVATAVVSSGGSIVVVSMATRRPQTRADC